MAAVGNFVWLDLVTPDPERAVGFYAEMMGWKIQDGNVGGQPYPMFAVGDVHIGGAMTLTSEMRAQGAPPHWMSYVLVESVENKTKRATALGGGVVVPPTDIPDVGCFSILRDPQGAVFALFQPENPAQMTVPDGPGYPCWWELTTRDHEATKPFYAEICGFTYEQSHNMGEMGNYDLYKASDPNGPAIIGMFTAPPGNPIPPNWLPYFEVADLDTALERVRTLGGKILNGPMDVPDGTRVAQCMDPQGAAFGLNQR